MNVKRQRKREYKYTNSIEHPPLPLSEEVYSNSAGQEFWAIYEPQFAFPRIKVLT